MAPQYQFQSGSDVRPWANSVRAAVQRLALPARVALVPTLTSTETQRGWREEQYSLQRPDGTAFSVSVRRPDDTAIYPAVIGVDSEAPLGDGLISVSMPATVAPEREQELVLNGRSVLAAAVDDVLAVREWLSDGGINQIGLAGGETALHAALVLGGSEPVAFELPVQPYLNSGYLALPGILRVADLPDLVAALAPRPLYLRSAHETVTAAYGDGPLTVGGSTVDFFKAAFAAEAKFSIPPLKVLFDISARVEVADNLDQVLASGMLTQGQLVGKFEKLANKFTGSDDTIAVSTGTAALDIAYQLLNVTGRTVLVPVNTFFATAASVERNGGKVEFVDIELDGFGMDPIALRSALEKHDDVAAVAVVHIGGIVAPSFREVLKECQARGIPVIEDTAHALGASLDGQLAGSFGAMGTYSLHPAKVATSGEGGLFTAVSAEHRDAARKLRDHGKISISQNIHDRLGNNWRLSEVHAAVGLAHFARLDELLEMRRALAGWYDEHLNTVPHVKRYDIPAGVESNYYKYMAFLDPSIDRAELKKELREKHGVSLAGEVYDVLLSDQPYYASRFEGRTFEKALWFTKHHICLPAFPSMTTREQEHVLNALRSVLS